MMKSNKDSSLTIREEEDRPHEHNVLQENSDGLNESVVSPIFTDVESSSKLQETVISKAETTEKDGFISSPLHVKNDENSSKKQSAAKPLLERYYPFPQSDGIHHDMLPHSKYLSPLGRKFCQFAFLTLLALSIYLGCEIYIHNYDMIPSSTYINTDSPNIPTYRLTFIGDSLIHRPYTGFNLGGRLQELFQTINLNITDHSVEGNTIADIRATIHQDIPPHSADMVLLLWDTDVSDYDESTMTTEQIAQKRASYLEDLSYVINATLSAGVPHMAISGPNILGEGPYFDFLLPSYIVGKTQMLEDYVAMNQDEAQIWQVDYIDMRARFLDALPSSWPLSLWWLTIDGEHPNDRGTGIVADQFANQISSWTGAPVT